MTPLMVRLLILVAIFASVFLVSQILIGGTLNRRAELRAVNKRLGLLRSGRNSDEIISILRSHAPARLSENAGPVERTYFRFHQMIRTAGLGPEVAIRSISYAFILMMVGAIGGYTSLIWLTQSLGRRGAYFLFCLASLLSSFYLFSSVDTLERLYWFMLVYGFFAIGGFGTFAVYLPELFPTRVRATGQGLCWNAARIVTAIGPLTVGLLVARLESYPAAALTTTVAYFIGLVAIWFGPETRGRGLAD